MHLRATLLVASILISSSAMGIQESPGATTSNQASSETLAPALARVHPAWRDYRAEWRPAPCPFDGYVDFNKNRIECGYVLVPENRRVPDSRLIRLSVARVAATVESPAAGTTVYLTGGPGVPIVGGAPALGNAATWRTRELTAISHFVLVDQRATGASEPFVCRDVYRDLAGDRPFSSAARERMLTDLKRCFNQGQRRGMDLSAYTTWDNAMDIRDVRRALEIESWNLYGRSYGTELVQMILQIDPAGVRAAVLDSVVAPSGWEVYSRGLVRSLDKLDAACQQQPDCAERFGDLGALARKAAETYADEPLMLDSIDPYIDPDRRVEVTDRLVAFALFRAFYSPSLYPALPVLMEAFAQRDEAVMRTFVESAALRVSNHFGVLLHVTASCGGWGRGTRDARRVARAEATYWSQLLHDDQWTRMCPELGLQPDPLQGPVTSDLPVLLVVGDLDPITLPVDAREAMRGMSNAYLVALPFQGHLPSRGNRCAGGIATQFLSDPSQRPNTDCVEEIGPPDFVTVYKPTRGPLRLANAVRDGDYMALAWGALPALVLLGAVFAFPLAAFGRRFEETGVLAPRPRLFAWLSAALGLAGVGLLALAFQQTVSTAAALVPLGLIGPTGWAAAALALALLAAVAALWSLRASERTLATTVGVLLTVLSVVLVFAFTVQRGLVF